MVNQCPTRGKRLDGAAISNVISPTSSPCPTSLRNYPDVSRQRMAEILPGRRLRAIAAARSRRMSVTSGFYPGHVGLGLCLGAAHRFIVYGS